MAYAQTLRNAILNFYKGSTFPAAPTTLYVALLTTNPSDESGTGLVEVVNGSGASQWNGYARQAITSSSGWSSITVGPPSFISNSGIISFPAASISSGTITVTGFALYTALTSGALYDWVTLTGGVSKVINDTDALNFAVGALVIQA